MGWSCGIGAKMLQLSDAERLIILNEHNFYRNDIALGKDKHAGTNTSSNMNALVIFVYDILCQFLIFVYYT